MPGEQGNRPEPGHPGIASGPEDSFRFSCPACGMILEASPQYSGVEAPCPGCGASICAPSVPRPIEVKPRLPRRRPAPSREDSVSPPPVGAPPAAGSSEMMAAPWHADEASPREHPSRVAGQPGDQRSGTRPPDPSDHQPGPLVPSVPAVGDRPGRRSKRRGISPVTGMSEAYQDRLETRAIIKVIVAVLVAFGLAAAVAFVTKRHFSSDPSRAPAATGETP